MEFLFSLYSLLKFHFQATNVLVYFIFLLKCVVFMHILRLKEILSNSLGIKDPSVEIKVIRCSANILLYSRNDTS